MPAPTIANVGQTPAGSTPVYTAKLVDEVFNPLAASQLTALTLTICDTLTGTIINGVQQANILNTGRGTLDSQGTLRITLLPGDTSLSEAPGLPQVQRSLIVDWTYNAGTAAGRHQINFMVLALAGA